MKIGIDGNEGNIRDKVGISEYVYELLLQLSKQKTAQTSVEVYLKTKPNHDFPTAQSTWTYKVFGPQKMWTQLALPARLFLTRQKPDVFFSPAHYAPRLSPVPVVISIMDLAFHHFPEMFTKKDLYQLKSWTEYSVKKAAKIITISQATKDDILKRYNIPDERVKVIYMGIKEAVSLTPHVYPMRDLQNNYGISSNYILFVGTLQPRKNIARAIEAFSKLFVEEKYQKSDLQFVIVGRKGWLYEDILKAPKKFGVEDRVKFLDFVPDEDLPALYHNAQCFLWPSLYEGFGLPILEAMKNDCPVITSNVSSLPEAGGDAALYVTPTDVSDIYKKLKNVLEDQKLRLEMIAKGKKHISKFSWEKAAKETLAVLEEVGEEK